MDRLWTGHWTLLSPQLCIYLPFEPCAATFPPSQSLYCHCSDNAWDETLPQFLLILRRVQLLPVLEPKSLEAFQLGWKFSYWTVACSLSAVFLTAPGLSTTGQQAEQGDMAFYLPLLCLSNSTPFQGLFKGRSYLPSSRQNWGLVSPGHFN